MLIFFYLLLSTIIHFACISFAYSSLTYCYFFTLYLLNHFHSNIIRLLVFHKRSVAMGRLIASKIRNRPNNETLNVMTVHLAILRKQNVVQIRENFEFKATRPENCVLTYNNPIRASCRRPEKKHTKQMLSVFEHCLA